MGFMGHHETQYALQRYHKEKGKRKGKKLI